MAVEVELGDVWRFTLRSSFRGQPCVNSIHLIITPEGGPTFTVTDQELGNALVNASPSPLQTFLVQAMNEEAVIREASAQWVYRVGDAFPGPSRLTYRRALNVPGVVEGNALPGQPSITLSAYGQIGSTKAMRGGIRVPGISEEQMVDGLISPSFISSIQAEANAMYLNSWSPVAVDPVQLDPILFSYTYWKAGIHSPYFCALDQVVIRQTPGTIRRRKEFSSTGGYPV